MAARIARIVVAGCLATALFIAPVRTQAQQADDKAAAEALFRQGKMLMAAGQLDAACGKLAESLRLDVGIGTMLYLAECYERSGKTASAWAEFREAEATAVKTNDAREKLARERALRLEKTLSRINIVVPPASDSPDLVVTRDGTPVGRSAWGTEVPIDPGTHVIRASAPDHESWETKVEVGASGARSNVVVPALVVIEKPVSPPPDATTPEQKPTATIGPEKEGLATRRVVAIGVGGAGVVAVAVGAVLGLTAISTINDADARCMGQRCDVEGVNLADRARAQANLSTVFFAGGAVAIAVAAVLWVTAPSGKTTAALTTERYLQPEVSTAKRGP
jgi:hypothetical protein